MHRTDSVALVTGASRGIGRAVAERLAAAGALVAVHYGRNADSAAQTVAAIEERGGRAFAVRAELGAADCAETLFAAFAAGVRRHIDDVRLDVLVNNAAVVPSSGLEDITAADFDRTFAVNARAPLLLVQRALPVLRDGGRIVTVSSLVTRTAPPEVGYVMSKGAVEAMTLSLARALGPRGITVNCVAPGLTATDTFPALRDDPDGHPEVAAATALGRPGQPEDIADVVAFLASHDGRWITGQTIEVSGGLMLGPRPARGSARPARDGGEGAGTPRP